MSSSVFKPIMNDYNTSLTNLQNAQRKLKQLKKLPGNNESILEPIKQQYNDSLRNLEEAEKKLKQLKDLNQIPKPEQETKKNDDSRKTDSIKEGKDKDSAKDEKKNEELINEPEESVEGKKESIKPDGKGLEQLLDGSKRATSDFDELDVLYIAQFALNASFKGSMINQKENLKTKNPEDVIKLQTYLILGAQLEENGYISINDQSKNLIKSKNGLLNFLEDVEVELPPEVKQQYLIKTSKALLNEEKPTYWNEEVIKANQLLSDDSVKEFLKNQLKGYGEGLSELSNQDLYFLAVLSNKTGMPKAKQIYNQLKNNELTSEFTKVLEAKVKGDE